MMSILCRDCGDLSCPHNDSTHLGSKHCFKSNSSGLSAAKDVAEAGLENLAHEFEKINVMIYAERTRELIKIISGYLIITETAKSRSGQ